MKTLLIILMLFCVGWAEGMSRLRALPSKIATAKVLVRAMSSQANKPTIITDRAFGHTYYHIMRGNELGASARVNWSEGKIFSFSVFKRYEGHGTMLLNRILEDFKKQNKSSLCIVTDPSQKNFFLDRGFKRGDLKVCGKSLYYGKNKPKEIE